LIISIASLIVGFYAAPGPHEIVTNIYHLNWFIVSIISNRLHFICSLVDWFRYC